MCTRQLSHIGFYLPHHRVTLPVPSYGSWFARSYIRPASNLRLASRPCASNRNTHTHPPHHFYSTMSLPTRELGGTQVNSIGFGAMGLSVGYGDTGSIEERLTVRCLDMPFDMILV